MLRWELWSRVPSQLLNLQYTSKHLLELGWSDWVVEEPLFLSRPAKRQSRYQIQFIGIARRVLTGLAWGWAETATTGGGGGHKSWPSCKTIAPLTTSSSRLMLKWSFSPIDSKNLEILLAYKVELCVGKRLGKSVKPIWTTSYIKHKIGLYF